MSADSTTDLARENWKFWRAGDTYEAANPDLARENWKQPTCRLEVDSSGDTDLARENWKHLVIYEGQRKVYNPLISQERIESWFHAPRPSEARAVSDLARENWKFVMRLRNMKNILKLISQERIESNLLCSNLRYTFSPPDLARENWKLHAAGGVGGWGGTYLISQERIESKPTSFLIKYAQTIPWSRKRELKGLAIM